MSSIIEERYERLAEIDSFGPSRVREAIITAHRKYGLSILSDNAQEMILRQLEADQRSMERSNDESRAIDEARRTRLATLKDGDIDPTTGCMVIRCNTWADFETTIDRAASVVTGTPAAVSKEA